MNVNASGSSDPDGTVIGYSWNWGDNTPAGSGITSSHNYAPGTYTITLTVTDNQGATATQTTQVTIAAPTQLAADSFTRTVGSGFGTADVGGAWSVSNPSWTSVDGAAGVITLTAGNGPSAYLSGVSATDVDASIDVVTDKQGTGGGDLPVAGGAAGRDQRLPPQGPHARHRPHALPRPHRRRRETALVSQALPALVLQPGQTLHLRVRVTGTGTTTLQGKAWIDAQAEPSTWSISTTDATAALQAPGAVGVYAYLSGSATNAPISVRLDQLAVAPG